jgi:butyryl-CoA:acetate CoA-transferase
MSYQTEYKQKLVSAAEAVKVVKPGYVVDYGFFNGKPIVTDQALADRADELENIMVYTAVTMPPVPAVSQKPDTFTYQDLQFSKLTRLLTLENKDIYYVPVLYHWIPQLLRTGGGPDRNVGIFRVCPMDQHGWFNFGPQNSESLTKLERDDIVIVEVCQNMPVCLGGAEEAVHISQVDYIVEAPDDHIPFGADPAPPSEDEKKIATLLMDHIRDGNVIQLGIGGLPNAVGRMIAESDLKDLGGHTEMFVDAYVDMIEAGRMNGNRKTFDRNRVAYTFAIGSDRMYEFMDRNPAIASYPVTYTNDPRTISRHDNFVSICNALEVDLYTQINAESSGFHQISGNGGMWDFVLGAQWSKNGKSFICLTSTYKDKQGNTQSRIVPHFKPGSITTIPRQMVDYVVTEYGVVQMPGLATWQRAEAMINLAHPDFRDDLIKAAETQGIWRQSNKRV